MQKPDWIDSIISILTELGLSKVQNSVQAISDSIRSAITAWMLLNLIFQATVSALCFSTIGLLASISTYVLAPMQSIETHLTLVYLFSGLFVVTLMLFVGIYRKITTGPSRSLETSLTNTSRQIERAVLQYRSQSQAKKERESSDARIENLEKSIEMIAQALKQTAQQQSESSTSKESDINN